MSLIIDLQHQLYEALLIERDTQQVFTSNYDVIEAFYPETELKNMVRPRVYVIAAQYDENKLTRCNSRMFTLPIQLAVQAKVDPTDLAMLNQLMQLNDSVRDTAAHLKTEAINWQRTEGVRDPNNTPMNFMELRERHIFQALCTAFYQVAVI